MDHSVNVNGINYNVKLTTSKNADLGEGNRGMTLFEDLKILLDKSMAKELRVKTFYHEEAQALVEATSLNNVIMRKFSDDDFEIFIDQLGYAIQFLLKNNDLNELENYIKKEE